MVKILIIYFRNQSAIHLATITDSWFPKKMIELRFSVYVPFANPYNRLLERYLNQPKPALLKRKVILVLNSREILVLIFGTI